MIEEFSAGYAFKLDPFQVEACRKLEAGAGVLVAAPTGSGKTVVGEFACWLALELGLKCFYTTPIKALSNQKFHDLVARHGEDAVGLLTGDTSINAHAPVVVMTTEVLRNMIYAGSDLLSGLGFVVMDEVHYLADRFRGAVWEEVILGLASEVKLVCLSATVSNAEEFGEWLDEVRGGVDVIVSESRPVPLYQHVMVSRRIVDLFDVDGKHRRVNPELVRMAKEESRLVRDDRRRPRSRRTRGALAARNPKFAKRAPRRDGTVETLAARRLLPAIFFVFSRAGCDQAVNQMLASQIDLTTDDEKRELGRVADSHIGALGDDDLRAIGWSTFREAFVRGIAAHHAGLLPALKTMVEEGFTRGLLKVVFATETLALGINMPAKTVVIEKLVKFNGETHAPLTPGEFTQLTGRAGRRGIDVEGHAVVFWRTGMDPRRLAGLASTRTYPLRSSFTPTYNMAVNLVASVGRVRARALLEQSFAQFQQDRRVVEDARAADVLAEKAAAWWGKATCERGDFTEYARLRDRIGSLETQSSKFRKRDHRDDVSDALRDLVPGDVIFVPAGKHRGWAAVLATGVNSAFPFVMTHDHQLVTLRDSDINDVVVPSSKVRIPKKFSIHSAADRRKLARSLDARVEALPEEAPKGRRPRPDARIATEIDLLRHELRRHPCHACPDRETHARFAEEALRLERTAPRSRGRHSIAEKFDRICAVLDSLGYTDGDHVLDAGRTLARIYNELDLVLAECLRDRILDDLSVPQLAAVLSTLVFESRPSDAPIPRQMPDRESETAQTNVRAVWHRVGVVERENRVDRTDPPDIGFAVAAYDWAAGASLATVLETSQLPAGDFVRWVRQVIDLASQIAQAPGAGPVARRCRELVAAMRRDIVDAGGIA